MRKPLDPLIDRFGIEIPRQTPVDLRDWPELLDSAAPTFEVVLSRSMLAGMQSPIPGKAWRAVEFWLASWI